MLAGTNSITDAGIYLAILSFITAIYLSWFIRGRRKVQDLIAVLGYLLYAAGLALLSAPNRFAFGEWTNTAFALGALCLGLLLALTWLLFVEYLID